MKKLIKKYLKKHLTAHPKHYYFLRWLADLIMNKEEVKDVCASIAYWIYNKKMENLLIYTHDILVIDNTIYIYTYRPGLWIGKAGRTVESCEHSINHNVNDQKIHNYKITFIEIQKTPWTDLYDYYHFHVNNW